MVNKLYGLYTDGKCNYAIKLDGEGKAKSNALKEYYHYNVLVAQFVEEEDDIDYETVLQDQIDALPS